MPESFTASMPATSANCVKRSTRFASLRLDVAVGRPVVDVAAELHLVVGGVERLDGVDAALAGEHALPQIVDLAAQAR